MKRLPLLVLVPVLGSCFQPWTVDGLYLCGGGCPSDMVCDDDVCCRPDGTPSCPTRVPASGRCGNGSQPKTWYEDRDNDGAGNMAVSRLLCARPVATRWVENGNDCDDSSSSVSPSSGEVCDGRDNDCDNVIDDGLTPLKVYFRDADGDGAGDATDPAMACALPPGYSEVSGDCAPTDSTRHPGAPELCNGLDDDCDNMTDEQPAGIGGACSDAGIGLCAAGTFACVSGALRCQSTYVPSVDVCNLLDDDCDGRIDERPDCLGPESLFDAGVVMGARDLQSIAIANATPGRCFGRAAGVAETWLQPQWRGQAENFHLWYAEAPGTTTWDLERSGLKLKLKFRATMLNANPTNAWTQFNQPVVLLCNEDATRFSRYRPTAMMLSGPDVMIDTDMAMSAGGEWLNPAPGVDLKRVKRIEILVQPADNGATVPGFTITFDTATGFKP